MKKVLLLGLVLSMAIGVTACTKASGTVSEGSSTSIEQEEQQYIYGKVKSIVGNEIEFELAKDPQIDMIGEGVEEETTEKDKGNGQVAATMTQAAMSSDENKKVNVGNIDKNQPLIELEFTQEEKTITIPTGIDINVLSQSTDKGLSAIKEGTYLRIGVDDNKAENPSILYVDVIS